MVYHIQLSPDTMATTTGGSLLEVSPRDDFGLSGFMSLLTDVHPRLLVVRVFFCNVAQNQSIRYFRRRILCLRSLAGTACSG